MLFLLFNDIMLKTLHWCKTRQIFSFQSSSSISDDEQFNESSSAFDEKSQCFKFHFRSKFISLKFLYVNAATQITSSTDERDKTVIFITSTDCTMFRLMFKQTFNDIKSWSRLSLNFHHWKMLHQANSLLSCKTSSSLIIFSDDRFISSKVCWDECRILTDSELLSSSFISSLCSSSSSLDSNVMNSTWFKNMSLFILFNSSLSSWSFDALINHAEQVSAYESSNENSQMQYLSQVNIVTSSTDMLVFASEDERLKCLNLKSVYQETINLLISFHWKLCTSTSSFVSSSAASSIFEIWRAHANRKRHELQERLERETSYAKKHSKKRRWFWIKYDHIFHSTS